MQTWGRTRLRNCNSSRNKPTQPWLFLHSEGGEASPPREAVESQNQEVFKAHQEMFKAHRSFTMCCSGMGEISQKLGLMILEIFSSLDDSVIFLSQTPKLLSTLWESPAKPTGVPVLPHVLAMSCLLWGFSSCCRRSSPAGVWQLGPGHQL